VDHRLLDSILDCGAHTKRGMTRMIDHDESVRRGLALRGESHAGLTITRFRSPATKVPVQAEPAESPETAQQFQAEFRGGMWTGLPQYAVVVGLDDMQAIVRQGTRAECNAYAIAVRELARVVNEFDPEKYTGALTELRDWMAAATSAIDVAVMSLARARSIGAEELGMTQVRQPLPTSEVRHSAPLTDAPSARPTLPACFKARTDFGWSTPTAVVPGPAVPEPRWYTWPDKRPMYA
jgi:hypothetical protein